jgi:hypothetical protein
VTVEILFHNVVCLGLLLNIMGDLFNIHNLYLDVAALLTCITQFFWRITCITHIIIKF